MINLNINPINNINDTEIDSQVFTSFGKVTTNKDGIIQIIGLDDVVVGEVIMIGAESAGMVINIENDSIKAIVLGDDTRIVQDDIATSTGNLFYVPVGDNLLGRIVDCLGVPMDTDEKIIYQEFNYIEAKAPGIISRKSVHEAMQTGILTIDSAVSIGRGQRELIIGDRQTGKTTIAIDTIINHRDLALEDAQKLYCIYVAIGQRLSSVVTIVEQLKSLNAFDYVTIVSAAAAEPASLQYLAPYTACAIGEYYRDTGKHALIIYDDLTKHATAYRQLSLLLRRPPGREAYPGDVFYIHSRLLERAAKMSNAYGNGSLSALPVIETQAGDVSGYIPTNVISITDGQIFLEAELFNKGVRPAINVGLSVSRIGSAAQHKLMKHISGSLKLELAQYREIAEFERFGSDLDEASKQLLNRGQHIVAILNQTQYKPMSLSHQICIIFAAVRGFLDNIPVNEVSDFEEFLYSQINTQPLLNSIVANILTNFQEDALQYLCSYVTSSWRSQHIK